MDFLIAYVAVSVLGLTVASYTDLKERIVPNKLNYALLFTGLSLHALESFVSLSATPIMLSFAGAAIAFFFSFILYKAGAWAGGDVKLFTALGALLPMPVSALLSPAPFYAYPLFPFMILINSVVVAFPFVMFYVFLKTLRNKKLRGDFKKMLSRTVLKGLVFAGSIYGLVSLLDFLGFASLLAIPILFAVAFLPVRLRWASAFCLFFVGLFLDGQLEKFAFLLALGWVMGGFFESLTHGMRALRKEIPIVKLEEGMISGELVYVEDGKARRVSRSWREKISPVPRGTVVSDLSAAGLSGEQIGQLEKLGVKKLLVKESIPLVPILLLGCITSLVIGDLVWFAIAFL